MQRPPSIEELYERANARLAQGDYALAMQDYGEMLARAPEIAQAWYGQGRALRELGRPRDAIASYERALAIEPMREAYNAMGIALRELGQRRAAESQYSAALRLDPRFGPAWSNLARLRLEAGDIEGAVAGFRRALEAQPASARMHSALLMTLNYHDAIEPQALLREHLRFAGTAPARSPGRPARPPRRAGEPLRVGYVSPDFRHHSVAHFVLPLFDHHDRDRFRVFAYSCTEREDETTALFRARADAWRDCLRLDAAGLAAQIASDGIDVLVDLAGHTAGNRLDAFAHAPAPVQATYLGYPTTSGLATMDFRITDAVLDPPGGPALNRERVLRLPGTSFCYRPPASAAAGEPRSDAQGAAIRFGSFGVASKASPTTLRLWAKLLDALPEATLALKTWTFEHEEAREAYRARAAAHGIDPRRLILLAPEASPDGHLRHYLSIDVALDTYPYNGATTTCEALWMGVPVVTLAGATHASRMGRSLLLAAGLGELVADSEDGYVETAVALARDAARRRRLHAELRERLLASPVCAELAFVRGFEEALEEAFRLAGTPA